MERRVKQVVFSRASVEAHGPEELNSFPKEAQVAVPILSCMRNHGVYIYMPRGMNKIELKNALTYVAHSSTVKEKAFVRKELSDQLRAGHVAIIPW